MPPAFAVLVLCDVQVFELRRVCALVRRPELPEEACHFACGFLPMSGQGRFVVGKGHKEITRAEVRRCGQAALLP